MHVINSGATTLISQILNGVRRSAYFHDDFQSKIFNFIQRVPRFPRYLQVGRDPEKFGNRCAKGNYTRSTSLSLKS